MRMAMNRIILGEMRDGEAAEAFIDVCSSGHAGMSTIHARSARDALARLELFLSRAQGSVPIETIRREIANAISVVVFLGMDKAEHKRRILSVLEVGAAADGVLQVCPIFAYAPSAAMFAQWIREPGISLFNELLAEHGVYLPPPAEGLRLELDHLYRENAAC
jgi:pilus assembly protein CpaF